MSGPAKPGSPRCEQTLDYGYVSYWNLFDDRRCGRRARYTWVSSLRGKMNLCIRHAKQVGLDKCTPIDLDQKTRAALQ